MQDAAKATHPQRGRQLGLRKGLARPKWHFLPASDAVKSGEGPGPVRAGEGRAAGAGSGVWGSGLRLVGRAGNLRRSPTSQEGSKAERGLGLLSEFGRSLKPYFAACAMKSCDAHAGGCSANARANGDAMRCKCHANTIAMVMQTNTQRKARQTKCNITTLSTQLPPYNL